MAQYWIVYHFDKYEKLIDGDQFGTEADAQAWAKAMVASKTDSYATIDHFVFPQRHGYEPSFSGPKDGFGSKRIDTIRN